MTAGKQAAEVGRLLGVVISYYRKSFPPSFPIDELKKNAEPTTWTGVSCPVDRLAHATGQQNKTTEI